jgi:hypothetical protein
MKYGKLNFLEISGTLQACNWTALPTEYSKHSDRTAGFFAGM